MESFARVTKQYRYLLAILALLTVVAACGVIPYQTARNEPICPESASAYKATEPKGECRLMGSAAEITRYPVPRARSMFSADDKDIPPDFIGLALSGGGSRAANFSMAVMEQLEQIGLMRHVTAISSTSGGGVAGAYYALRGPELDWRAAQESMASNFLGRWIFSSLRPDHLLVTTLTHKDRSDLMAEVLDDRLFDKATYGSLGDFGPGRPIFLANSTDATRGERFSFSHETFHSRLRSRLDTLPISQAVVASAAFPGAFNTVTLKRFPLPPLLLPPGQEGTPVPIGYEHLLDGGPSDNLGIESLIQLAASHHVNRLRALPPGARAPGCFLIVVDAYPQGVTSRKAWDPNPRGFFDYAIDMNFLDAFDALLTRRRLDLLAYVGLGQSTSPSGNQYIGDVVGWVPVKELGTEPLMPANQLVQFDVPKSTSRAGHPWSLIRPVVVPELTLPEIASRLRDGTLGAPPPVPDGYFRCTAWHLNLSGQMAVKPYMGEAGSEPQRLRNDDAGLSSPLLEHRAKLNRVVAQTETNFKLSGPANCSEKVIQDALYAAAFVVTREDHFNRPKVCDWFESKGLSVSTECLRFPGNQSMNLSLNLRAVGPQIAGRPGDSSVECVK